MDPKHHALQCLSGGETGTFAFPQIVRTLIDARFENDLVDLRLSQATYN